MGVGFSSSGRARKNSRVMAFHDSQKWMVHFENFKATDQLMVIDFSASWCAPCKFMEPIMEAFSEKYADVQFVKIDVDELRDVAQEFGIQAMPTFILIKNGREVDKLEGANREELEKLILKYRF